MFKPLHQIWNFLLETFKLSGAKVIVFNILYK